MMLGLHIVLIIMTIMVQLNIMVNTRTIGVRTVALFVVRVATTPVMT